MVHDSENILKSTGLYNFKMVQFKESVGTIKKNLLLLSGGEIKRGTELDPEE